MSNHRFILEPYKGGMGRHICPKCEDKRRTFVCYLDTVTSLIIHPSVGRCNREISCGYHLTPKSYFQNTGIATNNFQQPANNNVKSELKREISFISNDIFKSTLSHYGANNFVKFLLKNFGKDETDKLIEKYFIGTSKHWPGSTVFWQVDQDGKIRTGKIMLYNPESGKRVKIPFDHISWAHKYILHPDFKLKQCLFGEHLLAYSNLPVAVVESEKTAIIASLYLPQILWVSVGGISHLTIDKCQVLKGRKVILFPDMKGFERWSERAKYLAKSIPSSKWEISCLLEKLSTKEDQEMGADIADILLQYDWRDNSLS